MGEIRMRKKKNQDVALGLLEEVKIGYARVSSIDDRQKLGLAVQHEALKDCQIIYSEKQSGSKDQRSELIKATKFAKELADCGKKVSFCVYKMDRLSRKTSTLLRLVEDLKEHQIEFVSVKENIDTSTPTGILMYQLLGIFAEFELNNIRQRTREGLEQARKNGVVLGKPPVSKKKQREIIRLYSLDTLSVKQIAERLEISESTVYKIAKQHGLSRRKSREKSVIK